MSSGMLFTLSFAVLLPALLALWAGDWLRTGGVPRRWASFSGGVLAGAALLVVLPEVASDAWWVLAGFAALALVDRFLHPLCAGCGGGEPVWALAPLWLALAAHALLDGALIEMAQPHSFAGAILLGHRVPEVLAMLAVLRAASPAGRHLGAQVAALQLLVLVGFLLAAELNRAVLLQSYAFAGGAVLFLALHRLHRSWRESTFCWTASCSGAAGVWMVRFGLDLLG